MQISDKAAALNNARALSPRRTRQFESVPDGVAANLSIRSTTQKLHKAEEQERNETATATQT